MSVYSAQIKTFDMMNNMTFSSFIFPLKPTMDSSFYWKIPSCGYQISEIVVGSSTVSLELLIVSLIGTRTGS